MTDKQKKMLERLGLSESNFEPKGDINARVDDTEMTAAMAYVNSEIALAMIEEGI